MHKFTLPAGTICHRNGIPFALAADTEVESHADNEALIREQFQPSTSLQPLACSQSTHCLDNPRLAQAFGSNVKTTNSSLPSSIGDSKSLT